MAETLYEHAGGDEGLHRLEERTLFTTRVPTHLDHLTWFTAESFGGPDRFTRELGFAAVYLAGLDEAGLPAGAPFRQAVREHVEFGSHVAQRSSWAGTDADLHPIRQVPAWNWPS